MQELYQQREFSVIPLACDCLYLDAIFPRGPIRRVLEETFC